MLKDRDSKMIESLSPYTVACQEKGTRTPFGIYNNINVGDAGAQPPDTNIVQGPRRPNGKKNIAIEFAQLSSRWWGILDTSC